MGIRWFFKDQGSKFTVQRTVETIRPIRGGSERVRRTTTSTATTPAKSIERRK